MPIVYLNQNLGVNYIAGRLTSPTNGIEHTFGGYLPGVRPPVVTDSTALLLRLHLAHDASVAVFSSFDYSDRQSPFYFYNNIGTLHDTANSMLQFCECDPAVIVEDKLNPKDQDRRAIIFSRAGTDPDIMRGNRYSTDLAFSDHKTGGMPFFDQPSEELIEPSFSLMEAGYLHSCQLGSPSRLDAAPSGNWLFASYTFHLFMRRENNGCFNFHYCWG